MFRISKFIFLEIIQKDNPLYDKKNTLLENCYEYFDFDSKEIIYDNKSVQNAFMIANVISSYMKKSILIQYYIKIIFKI